MDKAIIMIQEEVINLRKDLTKFKKGTAMWRGKQLAADILENIIKMLKEQDIEID